MPSPEAPRADDRLSAQARKSLVVVVVLIAAALALTLPAALSSPRLNDSFWIDWVWLDQFARELASGHPYPRWLAQSHGGLGAPDFYYYPPVAFYIGALFVFAGLSTYAALIATFLFGYLLSGAATYAWLKNEAPRPLLGALVAMAAPYHALNFYIRGALAEFIATAMLPLVMLGLRRLSRGERGGWAIIAVTYGLLIATHLPLALLASIFLFGPYALWLTRNRPSTLVAAGAAFAAGIALAAIYLVPALALKPYRDAAKLWQNPMLQPGNWSLWDPAFWTRHNYDGVLLIAATLGIPLLVLTFRRSGWAFFGLVCLLIGIGAVPLIWSVPLLSSVQFPFRLLPVAELALAAAIAFATIRPLFVAVACLPLLLVTGQIATAAPGRESVSFAELRSAHPDVPENLPPGERPYSWPSRWALEIARSHRQPETTGGITVEPVFYFPSWQVRCGGSDAPTFADAETKLLAYRGSGCERRLGWTAAERAGAAISVAALLVLFGSLLASWLRVRSRQRKGWGGKTGS